jgi:hypothetical protein
MKLHSPQFEKALRKSVKRTVRSSPELKREFRRAKRFRRNSRLGWIFRPLFASLVGFVVWAATATTGHVATGLAIINLWMLASLSFLAQGMWTRLHASSDMGALTLLPISRERIFRWQLQKFFRYSLLTLLDLLVCFGALAYYCGFSPLKWAAAFAVAIVSWGTLLALVGFCLARLPRSPFQIISSGLLVIGVAVFFGRQFIWPIVLKAIDQVAPGLNLILPVGC